MNDPCPVLFYSALADLIRSVAQEHHIPEEWILSRSRSPKTARARWAVWATMYLEWRMSYSEIGRIWHYNHKTVAYGVRRYGEEITTQEKGSK